MDGGGPVRVSVSEAKAHFSELLARAAAGEEILVTRHGKPVARIAPPEAPKPKRSLIGAMKGGVWMSDDFDDPLEDFAEYM